MHIDTLADYIGVFFSLLALAFRMIAEIITPPTSPNFLQIDTP